MADNNTTGGALKKIKVHNWDEIPSVVSLSDDGCTWVVDSLIARHTVNLISGVSGCGKSYLTLALAGAVSTGTPLAGLATMQLPVVYDDRENPRWLVRQRMREMNIEDGGDFKYIGNWLDQQPGPEPTDEELISIRNYVLITEPRPLIIFDTMMGFFDGRNENDSADVREHMNSYRRLADLGATVIVLIHASEKSGGNYRGSTDYMASVDCAYKIEKKGKGQLIEQLAITNFKTRFRTHESLLLKFDGKEFDMVGTSNKETDAKLIALLKAHPGVQQSAWDELTQALKISRKTARFWLDNRVEKGEVTLTKGPKNASLYTWSGPKSKRSLKVA
jgi:RecA-family ATPase